MKEIKIMDNNPLVSIIVPAYNAEKYIAQTLDGLVKQTLRDIEIIVVDDGSVDNTKSVIDKFSFDRRLRYIKKENGGTGSALNVGHKLARGKYLTWCSADNVYLPNFAAFLSQCLDGSVVQNCSFIYSDFFYINANGQPIQEVKHSNPQPAADLVNGYDIGMSFMYTRELWEKVGDYVSDICEDFNWAVRAAQFTKFGLIKASLAGFRVHGEQISGNRKEEEVAAANKCKMLALEYLKSGKYDEIINKGLVEQFNPTLVENHSA